MRVLLTGMGGDFGAKTAALIEADPAVEAVLGLDAYPPRRRLHQSEFLRIDPRDTDPHRGRRPGVRPDGRRPPRRVGARRPGRTVDRPPAHDGRHPGRLRRRPADGEAGAPARPLRHRGLRPGPGHAPAPRRGHPAAAHLALWPYVARRRAGGGHGRAHGRGARGPLRFAPTVGVQYPSPLSAACCGCPWCPVNALSLTPLAPADFALLDVEDAAAAVPGRAAPPGRRRRSTSLPRARSPR